MGPCGHKNEMYKRWITSWPEDIHIGRFEQMMTLTLRLLMSYIWSS